MISVRTRGFRSIHDSGELPLGPVTVLTGPNNSGKSALIRSVFALQSRFDDLDRRRGGETIDVACSFEPPFPAFMAELGFAGVVNVVAHHELGETVITAGGNGATVRFPAQRPDHYLAPVFSRRKTPGRYNEAVSGPNARSVDVNDSNLTSRIATVMSGDHPQGRRYRDLVDKVLGLSIGTFGSENGQQPGLALSPSDGISLDRMGEGVSGVLSLILELADPRGRLFLVEEPENDLHPKALNALLDALTSVIPGNQLIVSTHSDVVLRRLAAIEGAIVYGTSLETPDGGSPTTKFHLLETREDRLRVLADLGYEPEVPAAWIVFEESTAERVCRQVLIPMFASGLAAAKTVASQGVDDVQRRVVDIANFVLVAHLSARYQGKVWVLVDGDEAGRKQVSKLTERFASWGPGHFHALGRPAFEHYYPPRFSAAVGAALSETDWKKQRNLKGDLAEKVCGWAAEQPEIAREELQSSAAEVIERLQGIEAGLASGRTSEG